MEDTGKLVQLGWSAGQRSKRAFHWVRNITAKYIGAERIAKLDRDAGSLFAFAWQRMRRVLPTCIVDDFTSFVQNTGLPRMDCDTPLDGDNDDKPCGTYKVYAKGQHFKFHGVELAPPGGVVGHNYSRYGYTLNLRP